MWPEGKRCAAAFTFDFDAEEGILAEDPANAQRPGMAPPWRKLWLVSFIRVSFRDAA